MPTTRTTTPAVVQVSNDDIQWIKKKLGDMDLMLHKLNATVVGDAEYGHQGLVQMVKEHSDYIAKDEKFKSKLVGGGVVFGAVWTFVLKFWDKIFVS
jgi:chemotaxis receptor (MCP) glutamine deamidase CheD